MIFSNYCLGTGNGNPIECCEDDSTNAPPRYRHPACAPLKIDVKEEDYTRLPSCLNYVRSALNVNPNCTFGPAQQVSECNRTAHTFFFSCFDSHKWIYHPILNLNANANAHANTVKSLQ